MSLDRVLFVVRYEAGRAEAVRARLDLLQRLYSLDVWTTAAAECRQILAGELASKASSPGGDVLVFGGPLPVGLDQATQLVAADDRALRSLPCPLAAVALTPAGPVMVTAPTGPTTLYTAQGPGFEVWSTHAVAAAVLAYGGARVDASAVPELLAADHLLGQRTLLDGVSALPSATRIEVNDSAQARCYWPLTERRARLPQHEARTYAEDALLRGLETHPWLAHSEATLGLTAGLDSRVIAAALAELDHPFTAITWGEVDWPDVRGAAHVAQELGTAHSCAEIRWWSDIEFADAVQRDALWSDGAAPVALGQADLPTEQVFVTGAGGEIGRAFYYRLIAASYPRAGHRRVARTLAENWKNRLGPHAMRHAAHLEGLADQSVDEAEQWGWKGWAALDGVYAEQRMQRWTRAMLRPTPAPLLPGFLFPEVERGLASLPLSERTRSGFHRRFLLARRPALADNWPRTGQRPGVPALARRAAGRWRTHHQPPNTAEAGLGTGFWSLRPRTRAWLSESVLSGPLLQEAMGRGWTSEIQRSFLAGDGVATRLALLAGSTVALDEALRELADGQPE